MVHGAVCCGRGELQSVLFAVLAGAAERRLIEFNAQGLANTAWAFASLTHRNEKLFSALAIAAEQRLSKFNTQCFINTSWAFATVKHRDEKLLSALAIAAQRRRLSDFNP